MVSETGNEVEMEEQTMNVVNATPHAVCGCTITRKDKSQETQYFIFASNSSHGRSVNTRYLPKKPQT
jgi:Tfp pilus assembly major pilin PilA